MAIKYVDHSAEVAASIDPEEVATLPLGPVVYQRGWATFHSLGDVMVNGDKMSLGVKIRDFDAPFTSQMLFTDELIVAGYLAKRVPRLKPKLPFLWLV